MPSVRLFGPARVAAGRSSDDVPAADVDELVSALQARYGEVFAAVAGSCAVFVNGEHAVPGQSLLPGDEVALLPPVSGGC
jgi:molybdopterin converting factor small subunit